MNKDEQQLLRDTISEFLRRNENSVISSEKETFDKSLTSELAQNGILGSRIPALMGGSQLPDDAYFVILNELSKGSPSLAVKVMIINSLFLPLGKKANRVSELFHDVASGKVNPTVSLESAMGGVVQTSYTQIKDGRLIATLRNLINSDCQVCVFPVGDNLAIAYGGINKQSNEKALGLNALAFSSLSIDTDNYEVLEGIGIKDLYSLLDGIDMEISAISLGIASAALSIAIEYAKQRKAFDHPLKDYEPISARLARMKFEVEYLTKLAESGMIVDSGNKIALKTRTLELAEEATNISIQVHGGYGYFEDFKVERYYRDITTLEALFVSSKRDGRRVSTVLYGENSGYL